MRTPDHGAVKAPLAVVHDRVSEPTRSGNVAAISCATMPPMEWPKTWVLVQPAWTNETWSNWYSSTSGRLNLGCWCFYRESAHSYRRTDEHRNTQNPPPKHIYTQTHTHNQHAYISVCERIVPKWSKRSRQSTAIADVVYRSSGFDDCPVPRLSKVHISMASFHCWSGEGDFQDQVFRAWLVCIHIVNDRMSKVIFKKYT